MILKLTDVVIICLILNGISIVFKLIVDTVHEMVEENNQSTGIGINTLFMILSVINVILKILGVASIIYLLGFLVYSYCPVDLKISR